MTSRSVASTRPVIPAAIALAMLFGCGDDPPMTSDLGPAPDAGHPGTDLGTPEEDAGPSAATVEWGACPEGFQTECAVIEMPLDHDRPDGPAIDVLISRRTNGGAKQLWLLQGGPGGSAAGLLGYTDLFPMLDPALEVYTIEHRGVGPSTRLGCAAEGADTPDGMTITVAEAPACLAELEATWGDDLRFFDTTQAAHDLARAIELTRAPEQPVFVWGGSYGSYWAHRYAVLHPDQPTGVLIDAAVQPGASLAEFPTQFEPIGRTVLGDLCPLEAVCAEKLGPDPVAFAEALSARLDAGHCAELGLEADALRNVFGVFLMSYTLREWLPALLYRLDRCDAADRAALETLFGNLFGSEEPTMAPYDSPLLQTHIVLSELWAEGVDPAAVAAATEGAVFRQDGLTLAYALQDSWPTYDPGLVAGAYAPPEVPALVTVGELDPAAPPDTYGVGYRDNLTGAAQHYVEIPYAAHSVLLSGAIPGALSCPMQLFRAFVTDPAGALPDCTEDVVPPQFSTPPSVTQTYWGTSDLYENP